MKPVSAQLLTLLKTRQFFAVDLWTFTLIGSTVLRYCSGDGDIKANGFTFPVGGQIGPYFDRTDNKAKCHWKVGTAADTLVVDVIPGSAQLLGAPFLQACRNGIFDGAEVMLERAFMPTYGDTTRGLIRMFVGRVAEIDFGRSIATFSINSHLELLNLQWPRNIAQSTCQNNLGDSTCLATVPQYNFTVAASPAPTIQAFTINLSGSPPAGALDQGTLTFTSGVLNGFTNSVRSAVISGSSAAVELLGFAPSAPASGVTGTITYGCNKSYTDVNGCPKFSNQIHFRGMPFTPQPAVAV